MKKFIYNPKLILLCILFLAFSVRLYKLNTPLADWHSWRQSDTSAVSRNFVTSGFDVLHPHFDDLSNVPSGKDNPKGYRFVEFPLYNVIHASSFLLFNYLSLEAWGRLVTIVVSLFSLIFLYLIVKRHSDSTTALFSAFFFAIIPYNVFYSRVILPDPSMVMCTLGAIYFFEVWIEESIMYKVLSIRYSVYFVLALIFSAFALLLKPFAVFFFIPMLLIAWNQFGFKLITRWQLWLFVILAFTPLFFWRLWMSNYPEGIPANAWLLNGGDIRFKGAYFYWIFADRIGRLILGYWGVGLLVIGLLNLSIKNKKVSLFFYSFFLSTLLYLIIIARGNVQHDYYQIPIIPSLVIFLGIGSSALLNPIKEFSNKYFGRIALIIFVIFMIGFGWYFVRDYYNINNQSIVIAGQDIDNLIPKDAKIIALYNGDTTFLYQTKRKGWASFQNPIPELVTKGASYLAIPNPSEQDLGLGNTYPIVMQTKDYVLFDLKRSLKK